MVKLFQPQENVIQTRGGISTGAAAAPGLAQAQAGTTVEQIGRQYFEEAKQANQTIAYSNAMTKATEAYTLQARQRMESPVDQDGNPNYESLVDDVGAIGKQIGLEAAATIIDPEVRRRFEMEFKKFDSNQRMQAFSAARKHQINFGRASLHENLRNRQQQAIQGNPEQLGFFEDQTRKELTTALQSGLISPLEHDQMQEQFRGTVRMESYRNLIGSDPAKMQEQLSTMDPATLGLNERERDQLAREATRAVEDQQREAARQEQLAQKAQQDAVNQAVLSFKVSLAEQEAGIEGAGFALKDLEAARGVIGEKNYLDLLKAHTAAQKRAERALGSMGKLSQALAAGEDVSSFDSKTVDKHLESTVAAYEENTGEPATLVEVAGIASGYGRQVRKFATAVNSSILEGSMDRAEEGLNAYLSSRDHQSKALDGNAFTNKAMEVAEYAELLIERGGLPVQEAITIARDNVLNRKDETSKQRVREFRKISDFTPDNIVETINSELDLESTFFGINVDVPREVQDTYRTFAQEAYLSTGDSQAANKIAAARMAKTHGMTSVGGRDFYMYAPPEKEFPGIAPAEMTRQLHTDVTPFLPEGIDVSQVSIYADDSTKGNFIITDSGERAEIVSYGVQYTKTLPDGSTIEMPLINPETGEPVAWFPSQRAAFEQVEAVKRQTVEEARRAREEQE